MTDSLRLVVNHPEGSLAPSIELPVGEGSALHLHLHLPSAAVPVSAPSAAPGEARRRSRPWLRYVVLLGAAAILVVGSYDVGTFAGHRSSYRSLAAATVPIPDAAGMPPALRAQLAQPPVVTPPPASPPSGSAFGLHP